MRSRAGSGGFTASEKAVLYCITATFALFAVVACLQFKRHRDVITARNAVVALERAVLAYCEKRGMPRDTDGDGIASAEEIIAQLKRSAFLPADFTGKDPWGGRYRIILRRDYEKHPETRRDYLALPLNDYARGVQVFSPGPDGRSAPLLSDVLSADDIGNCSDS